MATSVEAVHIRDLKKGQILTTIQKNKQTILSFFKSMTIRIYQECCHSGFAFQVDSKHNQTSSHSFFLLNC